jgi:hypothetical protein
MKKLVPAGAALLAIASVTLQTSDARATETCVGSAIRDNIVIVPIVASDTPSDTIISREALMNEAQWLRDWFNANSSGCYVPNIWIDSTQQLGSTIAEHCPNNGCDPPRTLPDAAHQVAESRYSVYGDPTTTQYIKVVMGAPESIHDTALTLGTTKRKKLDRALLLHELGHTLLGLRDAPGLKTTCGGGPFGPDPRNQDWDWTSCSTKYGLVMSPMSGGLKHYSAPEKYHVGFLNMQQVQFYDQKSSAQTKRIRLYASSQPMSGAEAQLIRIKLTNTTDNVAPFYWIEYRHSTEPGVSSGTRVHVYWQPRVLSRNGNSTPGGDRYTFISSPAGTADPVSDAPFVDTVTGITITPGDYTDEYVDLTVLIPGF